MMTFRPIPVDVALSCFRFCTVPDRADGIRGICPDFESGTPELPKPVGYFQRNQRLRSFALRL